MRPEFKNDKTTIYIGDAIEVMDELPERSIHCFVTSPPYWRMRDYKVNGQIGLEPTPEAYIRNLVEVFRSLHRVLRDDGTAWLNIGDTYINKSLVGIPWRLALALKDEGWYIRSDIIWNKSNGMPHSVKDRPVGSHEYIFLLTKSDKYYYDREAVMEKATGRNPGNKTHKYSDTQSGLLTMGPREFRNKRDVWTVGMQTYRGKHTAVFPEKLIEPCVLAGTPVGGTVLDCFAGTGTVGLVAQKHNRKSVLIEINQESLPEIKTRLGVEDG